MFAKFIFACIVVFACVRHISADVDWCQLGCECPEEELQFTYIVCSNGNITDLPDGIQFYPNISGITLRENRIRIITRQTFFNSPSLEELDLSYNELETIEDDSFNALPGLLYLHLSGNNFTTISPFLLRGLQKLEMLELGHNRLTNLPDGIFANTPVLKELKLQSNSLTNLSCSSLEFLNLLEKLHLQNNSMTFLNPCVFQHLTKLQWLSLSENHFEIVPKQAFQVATTLRYLDLSSNKFVVLRAESFSTLSNLHSLYLNGLESLKRIEKRAFSNMTNLKLLSCNYNKNLHFVHPEAFAKVESKYGDKKTIPSEKLLMGHNGLKSLPEPTEIQFWITTETVDLKENPWRCDCKLRWMARLKPEISSTITCQSPLIHHGRSVADMVESDFVCEDHWALSTVMLVLIAFVALAVCSTFVMLFACYRTPLGHYVKAKSQFSYVKVPPRKDCVDLEWDPTADV